VRCEGGFSNFVFTLNGLVASANDGEIRIRSSDTMSEVAISLTPNLDFGYADNRAVTGEAKKYESAVVVFFSPVPDEGIGEPDTMTFAALTKGSRE